jgi:hypothetical protein
LAAASPVPSTATPLSLESLCGRQLPQLLPRARSSNRLRTLGIDDHGRRRKKDINNGARRSPPPIPLVSEPVGRGDRTLPGHHHSHRQPSPECREVERLGGSRGAWNGPTAGGLSSSVLTTELVGALGGLRQTMDAIALKDASPHSGRRQGLLETPRSPPEPPLPYELRSGDRGLPSRPSWSRRARSSWPRPPWPAQLLSSRPHSGKSLDSASPSSRGQFRPCGRAS